MDKNSNRNGKSSKSQCFNSSLNRRKFIGGLTSATVGISIVPAHVLGGRNHVAPSDKINVAYIGTGTQGLLEMPALLKVKEAQVVAVCDPQKYAIGYYDWGPTGLRDRIRRFLNEPDWQPGGDNRIPGGLENGKNIVETYYNKFRHGNNYMCAAYTDFREMFEKEKGIDAVKVMTPDHLHGVAAIAAMKRGIHVSTHKPLSNRLEEGYKVIEMAKKSDVITHFIPWASNGTKPMEQIRNWINGGVIGELKEIHNWSRRPVWPQYAQKPTDTPKMPKGFDWDLWLGPEAHRPYHPHYTNMVFRGWYDFGGGAMADMGHYSLWTVFRNLELENPTIIEPNLSHVCALKPDSSAYKIHNDFSFPFASSVRFKFPAKGSRPAVDLIWHDGGMRPPVPDEFYEQHKEFTDEGMMFVGNKGIIMSSDFLVREPYILSGDKKLARDLDKNVKYEKHSGIQEFIDSIRSNRQMEASFRYAWSITEAVNLYAAALRSGKTLKYDAKRRQVTNVAEANSYLVRGYRKGWGPEEI